eukprot:SAG31_NODE_5664_length_2395_cov_1.436847_1_plen_262_part_00
MGAAPWLGLFVAPDFDSSVDVALCVMMAVMVPLVGAANVFNLPLVNRSGGLFTYSKFAHNVTDLVGVSLPTRAGMVLLYSPAGILAAVWAWSTVAASTTDHLEVRSLLPAALTAAHFTKRVLECLFLHKYSGTMPLLSSLNICFFYTLISWTVCWYSAAVDAASYSARAQQAGVVFFIVGLLGNCYHHWLLASLRKPGETGYKVPSGGLFELVAAPHYLFELIGWYGLALVAQHAMVLLFVVLMSASPLRFFWCFPIWPPR